MSEINYDKFTGDEDEVIAIMDILDRMLANRSQVVGHIEEKTLSALSETTGGALVAPPKQSKLKKRSKLGSWIPQAPRLGKSLFYFIKADPVPPKAGESYFATCERDDEGHCLPSGQSSGQSGSSQEQESDKPDAYGRYGIREIDASELIHTEEHDDVSNSVRRRYPEGEPMPPIVVRSGSEGKEILDGHNRAMLAEERGEKISYAMITEEEYTKLEEEGFEQMHITFATLQVEGEYDEASAMDSALGGYVADRGMEAARLLEEWRTEEDKIEERDLSSKIKGAGQPCKRGERASFTGCIPASKKPAAGKPVGQTKPTPKKKPTPRDKKEAKAKAKVEKEKAKQEVKDKKTAERLKIRQDKEAAIKAAEEAKTKLLGDAKNLASGKEQWTKEKVEEMGQSLLNLKIDQLRELKAKFSLKLGKTKADIVTGIIARAKQSLKQKEEVKVPEPVKTPEPAEVQEPTELEVPEVGVDRGELESALKEGKPVKSTDLQENPDLVTELGFPEEVEQGFSSEITDSLGRTYRYVKGKRVKTVWEEERERAKKGWDAGKPPLKLYQKGKFTNEEATDIVNKLGFQPKDGTPIKRGDMLEAFGQQKVDQMINDGLVSKVGNIFTGRYFEFTPMGGQAVYMALNNVSEVKTPTNNKEVMDLAKAYVKFTPEWKKQIQEYLGLDIANLPENDWFPVSKQMHSKMEFASSSEPMIRRIGKSKQLQELVSTIAALPDYSEVQKEKDKFEIEHIELGNQLSSLERLVSDKKTSKEGKKSAKIKIEEMRKQLISLSESSFELSRKAIRTSEVARNKLKENFKVDNPVKLDITPDRESSSKITDRIKGRIDSSIGFLDNMVSKGDLKGSNLDYLVKIKEEGYRANYQNDYNLVSMSPSDNETVYIHEMGHGLEHNLPGAHEAVSEFLKYRMNGEKPTKLKDQFPNSHFEDGEFGTKDNFDRSFSGHSAYYVGKYYSDNSEIISMGLQQLYEDPIKFARKDPEYMTFILGILDGSLRNVRKA